VRFDREFPALFRALPIAVGHVSQVARPGDYFTHDASGLPLLVARGDDGRIRAFLNVCRHRGTRIENAPCGQRKAFVCPYHAWSYGRDGQLLGIPHEAGFAGLVRAERGLVEVPCDQAAGLVFVRPAGTPVDAAGWLAPVLDDLVGFGIDAGIVDSPVMFTKQLSWKLAIDIFLEAYHLRSTHRHSIFPMFFDNVALVDLLGPHVREVLPKRTIREVGPHASLRHHANVLYHVFPNTLILVEPDHAAVLHIWPRGAAETVLTAYTLIPEPATAEKARAHWDANSAILYSAVDEDFAMGESIQRGLAAGANREVMLGAFEHALAHFHRQIAEHTAGA
jgi:phenylpropionate dioxygenase-like ring-hydroxylating dioxygenase large terminal subunit